MHQVSSAQPADAELLYEVHDGIGRVTFNRPQARNAMTFAMYERLARICEEANDDRSLRVLVLTGQGDKAFASGTDINQFRAFKTPQDALEYEARIDRILTAVEQCRIPTIAAIAGACTGGGAGIAACCDMRIAAANAKMGFPIARTLGNCLSMAAYASFVDVFGPSRLKELIFTARLLTAEEAHGAGYVHEIVPAAQIEARVTALAHQIAEHAPITLWVTKESIRRLGASRTLPDDEDLIATTYMSADFREGVRAFLDKRKPQWSGK